MPDARRRTPDAGRRTLYVGHWTLDDEGWMLDAECRKLDAGCRRELRDAPALQGQGTKVIGLRVTDQEVRDFEVAIGRLGLTKTEALKRLMHSAATVLAPDEEVAERLKRFGAEVNRVGGNLNQLSRACNEARLRGEPIPYTAQSHAEVRAAIKVVFEAVAQVGQLARGQRRQLDVVVAEALQAKGGGDEPA